MVKIAVFASGNGSNFEKLVQAKDKNYSIELLIVDQEDAFALDRAKNLGIRSKFINPKNFNSKNEYEKNIFSVLKEYSIEYIVLAGYMRIISSELLRNFEKKIINIHPSYLPEFPGRDSIGDVFRSKISQTGITIHYIDEGIDTGEIIYQERIDINPLWSKEELTNKIHEREHIVYPKVLKSLFDRSINI